MVEAGIPADRRTSSLKRSERLALIDALTGYPLPWSGNEGYKKAEVTGGGVALGEVDPKTLESKRVAGLYLCGEMLDAFGPIGGHNFSWAWATGRAAGLAAGSPIANVSEPGAPTLNGRAKSACSLGLLLFSGWSVYTRYVDLHAFDLVTNMPFRDLSMSQYNDTLAGVRTFPYQWRVLGLLDGPRRHDDRAGRSAPDRRGDQDARARRVGGAALYVLDDARQRAGRGARDGDLSVRDRGRVRLRRLRDLFHQRLPRDPLVVCRRRRAARRGQWWLAALAAFAGAWAKETAMLIAFLAGFEALRKRGPWSAAIACGIAFAIPTLILRTIYPAPLAQWAWWDTFKLNVPFIVWDAAGDREGAARQPEGAAVPQRDAGSGPGARGGAPQDSFVVSLGLTLACYVVLAWMVVYIRELRHMLPFTILVIPLAVPSWRSSRAERRENRREPDRSEER